jgi:hypothetical protein
LDISLITREREKELGNQPGSSYCDSGCGGDCDSDRCGVLGFRARRGLHEVRETGNCVSDYDGRKYISSSDKKHGLGGFSIDPSSGPRQGYWDTGFSDNTQCRANSNVYSNCKPKPTTGSNGRVVIPQFRRENIPDSGACNTRYGNWGMDTYIRNSELHVRRLNVISPFYF